MNTSAQTASCMTAPLMSTSGRRLSVRSMTTGDVDAVMTIETAAQSHPWKASHFHHSLQIGNLALVVEDAADPNGAQPGSIEIVAFVVVSCGAQEAELLNIAVARHRRQQGIAKALLSHVLQRVAVEADTIFLEVRKSNRGAIALYHGLDFNQVGERRDYYPSTEGREDALIFARTLLKY